ARLRPAAVHLRRAWGALAGRRPVAADADGRRLRDARPARPHRRSGAAGRGALPVRLHRSPPGTWHDHPVRRPGLRAGHHRADRPPGRAGAPADGLPATAGGLRADHGSAERSAPRDRGVRAGPGRDPDRDPGELGRADRTTGPRLGGRRGHRAADRAERGPHPGRGVGRADRGLEPRRPGGRLDRPARRAAVVGAESSGLDPVRAAAGGDRPPRGADPDRDARRRRAAPDVRAVHPGRRRLLRAARPVDRLGAWWLGAWIPAREEGRGGAMIGMIIRRLAIGLLVMWGAATLIFVIVRIAPGDPAAVLLGPDAEPGQIARLRAELGLDQPVPVQYWNYLIDTV